MRGGRARGGKGMRGRSGHGADGTLAMEVDVAIGQHEGDAAVAASTEILEPVGDQSASESEVSEGLAEDAASVKVKAKSASVESKSAAELLREVGIEPNGLLEVDHLLDQLERVVCGLRLWVLASIFKMLKMEKAEDKRPKAENQIPTTKCI